MELEIPKLEELLKLNLGDQKEIIETSITNLTAPGENYWSRMFKIDVTVKNKENSRIEIVSVVAKCVVKDTFQESMNIGMFKSEIKFYEEVVPTIQGFLRDHHLPEITFYPEFIGARLNLSEENQADKNAVLILENLIAKGYSNLDRHKGFNFDSAKVLLADLAVFHAVPLAIRLKDPQCFKEKIEDNCHVFKPPEIKEKDPPPVQLPFDLMRQILLKDVFCRSHIGKFDKLMEREKARFARPNPFGGDRNGVFSTLIHNDMWINNTMQLTSNGKVVKNKFVDFQVYAIDNPALDLLFFLITSVQLSTMSNHFDYLLSFYHEKFIQTLEALKCETKPFAYKYFLANLKNAALEKFFLIMLMTATVIFAKKGQKTDFGKNNELHVSDVHPIARQKICFMFSEMVKRHWALD